LVACTTGALELVKDIGLVVAALDPKFEYLSRSFCILETFAAVAGNADLFCFTRNSSGNLVPFGGKDGLNSKCMNQPVNSSQAATRNAEDKAKIDRFIEGSCGFAELDKLVSRAILDGAAGNGSSMCTPRWATHYISAQQVAVASGVVSTTFSV